MPKNRQTGERSLAVIDPLAKYLQEVQHYPFVTEQEERKLAIAYRKHGDIEAARKLVSAHLRLVVKIAMEYRQAYYNVLDLIQEGNVGLMHAVKKFDPDKGARFSYYASWWIRLFILKYILDNFRLIRIGTTKEQKKLFYNLMREKQKIEALGFHPDRKLLSKALDVSEKAIDEMSRRLEQPEYALEAPVGSSGEAILKDFIAIDQKSVDDMIAAKETKNILEAKLKEFTGKLEERELKIFSQRLMADLPITLQEIADEYGISKERVRQIEERMIKRLKEFFKKQGIKAEMLYRE
jgi:RNA polymerase sigma-32 factor